jgi:hypothetical protein
MKAESDNGGEEASAENGEDRKTVGAGTFARAVVMNIGAK